MTDLIRCAFTREDGARCVFGANHTVDYHHLDSGAKVPVPSVPVESGDTSYEDRVVEALRPQLPGFGGIGVGFIARTVLAVRDAEMERLRAELNRAQEALKAAMERGYLADRIEQGDGA